MTAGGPRKDIMVRLRSDQMDQLKALAVADDRSVAYLVRKAVDAYLEQAQR